ncbi:MAG TPA: hypothetical protein VGA61_13475 [Anaerolineae bacterium]
MSRNTKIVLGLLAALLVVCLCGAVVLFGGLGILGTRIAQNTTTQPAQVANVAHTIVDYQLPEGWQAQFGMNIAGVAMAGFRTNDSQGYAMLMKFPAALAGNESAMENQFNQSMQRQNPGAPRQMQTVGRQTVTIRGQSVQLTVSEGTNGKGVPFHALTGFFQSDSGPVLLSVGGPKATWNEQQVMAFIASIR